jgi:hypothetical protein
MGISSFTVTKENKLITFDKSKIEKCIVARWKRILMKNMKTKLFSPIFGRF